VLFGLVNEHLEAFLRHAHEAYEGPLPIQEVHCVTTFSTRCAALPAMRLPAQLGHSPRSLHEKETAISSQSGRRSSATSISHKVCLVHSAAPLFADRAC
jgi:hypothetical protein